MKRLSIFLVVVTFAATCFPKTAPAEEASGIPDEVVKVFDDFVGKWEAEGKIGDNAHSGIFTCRWARTEAGKNVCLIGKFSYETGGEERSGVNLIGWNSAKECVEDRGFNANGDNATLYWTLESPNHWRGEIIAARGDETITAKADFIKKSESEWVMEAEYDNGDVSRVVYRKVKRERKKKAKE
jgi:hypothetical protein